MKISRRLLLAAGLAILGSPGLCVAQEPIGIVTTLSGQATRTASMAGETPAPLRFKDGIFGADTIRTAERSFVRMLLERKALLPVPHGLPGAGGGRAGAARRGGGAGTGQGGASGAADQRRRLWR